MALILIFLTVLFEIVRELFFKVGITRGKALIACGVAVWTVEVLMRIRVFELVPLSVAFPMMSLSYVGLPLAGRALLKETITSRQWLGIMLVTLGVALVGMSGIG